MKHIFAVLFSVLMLAGCATKTHAQFPGTAPGTYQGTSFVPAPFNFQATLAAGITADNMMNLQIQAPSQGFANSSCLLTPQFSSSQCPAYSVKAKFSYESPLFNNMQNMGLTYIRIPIDIYQLLPGLPFPKGYLTKDNTPPPSGPCHIGNCLSPTSTTTPATASFNASISTAGGGTLTIVKGLKGLQAGATSGPLAAGQFLYADTASATAIPGGVTITGCLTGCSPQGTGSTFSISSPLTVAAENLFVNTVNLANPNGCDYPGGTITSDACTVAFDLQYLDANLSLYVGQGQMAAILTVFGDQCLQQYMGNGSFAGGFCPALGDTWLNGTCNTQPACYGFANYEALIQAADLVLVNRYSATYPKASQLFFELLNEPHYNTTGSFPSFAQPAVWNAAVQSITNAIRATGDNTHWLVSDCMSAALPSNCDLLTPTSETIYPCTLSACTIVSTHMYGPNVLTFETTNNPWNPLLIYPGPSTPGPNNLAVGRTGGTAVPNIPFFSPIASGCPGGTPDGAPCINQTFWPAPWVGSASNIYTTGSPLCSGTPHWPNTNSTPLNALNQMKACVVGNASNAPNPGPPPYTQGNGTMVDYFTNYANKGTLVSNGTYGLGQAFTWAATASVTSGPVPFMIGEFSAQNEADYLSRLQWDIDIISIAMNTTIGNGGQVGVLWGYFGVSARTEGLQPKVLNETDVLKGQQHVCLGQTGVLQGIDLDVYAILSQPGVQITPACSGTMLGGGWTTPGVN